MKVVIAQHKGGVGKTSLATHIAGVLNEVSWHSTLLMDCDTQGDAYEFISGQSPEIEFAIQTGKDDIDVLWNPYRNKLSNANTYNGYDNIVVDINTRFTDALQIIMELSPDMVLIPINNQKLSTRHLYEVLSILNEVQGKIVYPFKIRIVQMGSQYDLKSVLSNLPNVPVSCFEDYRIPFLHRDFDDSLFNSSYIWEMDEHQSLKIKFMEVISNG